MYCSARVLSLLVTDTRQELTKTPCKMTFCRWRVPSGLHNERRLFIHLQILGIDYEYCLPAEKAEVLIN